MMIRKSARSLLIFAVITSAIFSSPALAAPSDGQICNALPSHLVPLRISKARYGEEGEAEPYCGGLSRHYVGHAFIYTQFSMHETGNARDNLDDYVLAAGKIFERSDPNSVHLDAKPRSSVLFVSQGHFCSAGWINNYTSDLVMDADPSVLLIFQALKALHLDDAIGRPGVAVRLAEFEGHLYLITTHPKTMVAEISYPRRTEKKTVQMEIGGRMRDFTGYDVITEPPRLFFCDQSIGDLIAQGSERSWRMLKRAHATRGAKTCE